LYQTLKPAVFSGRRGNKTMILIGISVIFILSISFFTGALLNSAINLSPFERNMDRFIFCCWTGLFLCGFVLLCAAFFLPLNPLNSALIITFLLIILFFCCPKKEKNNWHIKSPEKNALIFNIMLLPLLMTLMALPVRLGDTGVYHFGVIKWLSEYGIIKGFGLLTEPFCNPTIWFGIFAPFNSGLLTDRMAALPGAVVMTLVLLQWTNSLRRCLLKKERKSDLFLLPALFLQTAISLQLELANSPSPDLPNTVLPILICWLLLLCHEEQKNILPPVILASGAVLIKFNALPSLLIILFFLFYTKKTNRLKRAGKYLISYALLLFPLLMQGIISCGCPFYPASPFCLDLPWAFPLEIARKNLQSVIEHGRWCGIKPPAHANSFNWLPHWIQNAPFSAFLVFCSLIATLIIIRKWRTSKPGLPLNYRLAAILGWIGIVLMLLSSPIARYGLGFLASIISLSLIDLKAKHGRSTLLPMTFLLLFFLLTDRKTQLFSDEYLRNGLFKKDFFYELLIQPPLLKAETLRNNKLQKEQINGINFYLRDQAEWDEEGSFCWSSPLPCTWKNRAENLKLLQEDKGLSGGFMLITAPITDSE
jgi:hypothetical protein